MPDNPAEFNFPASAIPEYDGQRIDDLLKMLSNHEDTEMHEMLMKAFWNKFYGVDIYEVNMGTLLDFFDTNVYHSITGGIVGNSIKEKVWFSLKALGYSDIAIAGVMGNIHWESGGFDPSLIEAGVENGGIGLCQWSYGRKEALMAYAESKGTTWQDVDTQIEFLIAELTGEGRAAAYATKQFSGGYYEKWKNATTVEEATEAFCWGFERPSKSKAHLEERKQYAEQYYGEYQGKEAFAGTTDTVSVGGHTYPHYRQSNFDHRYGSKTISSSGCGPTSLAMVLAGLLDNPLITPETVVEDLEDYFPDYHSYYLPGAGSIMPGGVLNNGFLGEKYGVKMTQVSTEEGIEAVASGKSALGSVEGHILAIVPVPEEYQGQGYKFYVIDSGRSLTGPYRSAAEVRAKKDSGGIFNLTYIIEEA